MCIMNRNDFQIKSTGYPSIDKPWLKYYDNIQAEQDVDHYSIFDYMKRNNVNGLDNYAINFMGNRVTYRNLLHKVLQVSSALKRFNVNKNDVVTIALPNIPEAVYLLYACSNIGAVANFVSIIISENDMKNYLCEVESKIIFILDEKINFYKNAINTAKIHTIVSVPANESLSPYLKIVMKIKHQKKYGGLCWKEFLMNSSKISSNIAEKNDVVMYQHTGGTTGFPKTVMITNVNMNYLALGYKYAGIPFARQHKFYNDLPPFIAYGVCVGVHAALCHGLEIILYPIFDPKGFPKKLKKYKPNHFAAGCDHLQSLLKDAATNKLNMSFLLTPAMGGDSLNEEIEKKVNLFLNEHHCKYEVVKGYGMTEMSTTICTSSVKANAIGSVGIPMYFNNIKIIDLTTGKEVQYNEMGEILVSGPTMMKGYLGKELETQSIMSVDDNGIRWIRTGDIGYMNEDGLLFHKGRIKRIYVTLFNGQPMKVFPAFIEEAFSVDKNVIECAVVGRKMQGSTYYESIAFIVTDRETDNCDTEKQLRFICEKSISEYMHPVKYVFLKALPRTSIGKIDYCMLEKMAEE